MSVISRALVATALIAAPLAASADTLCSASTSRGDWLLSYITDLGSPATCEVTFTNYGNFTGNCYWLNDEDTGLVREYGTISGRFTLWPSCAFAGTLTVTGSDFSVSGIVDGRMWAPRNSVPMVATAISQVEMQDGLQFLTRLDMHRRIPGGAVVVPVLP